MEDNQSPVDDMPDVSLMDNDIAPAQDVTPSETPVEQQAANEGTDTQEEPKTDESPSEGEQQPAEQQQPQQQDDEAAIKARNEAFARQRIQERQRTKQAVAQQVEQFYGPKSEEDLINEGLDANQAQIEALRQEMQFERQKAQIAEMNAGLQAEAVNVASDFPIFDPNSKAFDAEFAKEVEESYRIAARLQTEQMGVDQHGNPITVVTNAEVPLYDYYQRMANIYNRGTSRGQEQGQQEYQQMLARTENPGGSSSTTQSNSLDDLEARLADVVIT